jgi:hypothetical protein
MDYREILNTVMQFIDEDTGKFLMVTNKYIYRNVRNYQLRNRQQQVNSIAHVPASANFDDAFE